MAATHVGERHRQSHEWRQKLSAGDLQNIIGEIRANDLIPSGMWFAIANDEANIVVSSDGGDYWRDKNT